jgi:type IV pilus assembly protein PilB
MTATQQPAQRHAIRPPRSPFDLAPSAPLGERLINAGLINAQELESAIHEHSARKTRLGEALIQLGFLEEDELLPFLGDQLGVPSVRLREGLIDPRAVKLIPRAVANRFQVMAIFRVRDTLTVAMAEPQNLQQIDEIERITKLRVRPVLVLRSALEKLLPRAYEDDYAVDAVTADMAADSIEITPDAIDIDQQQIESLIEGSPVVNLVNYLIMHAVRQGASDIHIEPGHKYTAVRYRVDGQLREVLRPRRDLHPAIVSRLKVMGKMDIAEHRAPQDGRIHVIAEGREIDLRISTLPTVLGEKVVLRVLDRRSITFNLEELGVPDNILSELRLALSRPHGLLLVTGPTGSGKTTTLYSAVELIKSIARNIVTVEDPVEYQLELINQVQVSATKSMSFAGVLRSILRQDPDVIMVGEIRDAETAEMAIQAALTGHLVLSTLHTNDSPTAITRLIDMGIAPFKISASLAGVLAQRLVRTLCPNCRTPYYPTAQVLEMLRYRGDRRRQFHKGSGCQQCFDTGFRGRTGIYEFLRCTTEMKELITNGAGVDELWALHRRQAGSTLLEEGLKRAEEGVTSIDEIMRVAYFD